MPYRDILVHLDNSAQSAARLSLAISLARRHQAHLTGLYVISHQHYKPEIGSHAQKAAEQQSVFERETGEAGIGAEWRCAEWSVTGISVTDIVIMHAYCKDLVIIGQTQEKAPVADIPAELPERVILESGRPVLVVPYAGIYSSVGVQVMVSWHYDRESVRALSDAMPLLESADHVGIVEVIQPSGGAEHPVPGIDLAANLTRHAIRYTGTRLTAGSIPTEDLLLNHAWENGYDLLVMEAYTKGPLGVMVLSDVARHVLKQMTVPILFSH